MNHSESTTEFFMLASWCYVRDFAYRINGPNPLLHSLLCNINEIQASSSTLNNMNDNATNEWIDQQRNLSVQWNFVIDDIHTSTVCQWGRKEKLEHKTISIKSMTNFSIHFSPYKRFSKQLHLNTAYFPKCNWNQYKKHDWLLECDMYRSNLMHQNLFVWNIL